MDGVQVDGHGGRGATKGRLLAEAVKLFGECGYHGASMRELAERLGITKASLYHHVASKEDLLFMICETIMRRATDSVSYAWANSPAELRLRSMVVAHLRTVVQDAEMHKIVLIEMTHLSPERRTAIKRLRDDYAAMFRTAITQDQADGRIRTDRDPQLLMLALMGLLNWPLFWFKQADELSLGEMAEFICSVFVEGVRVPGGPGR